MGPSIIICGRTYEHNLFCRLGSQFSKSLQNHEKITKTIKVHIVGTIALRPSGNVQNNFIPRRRLHRCR